jgi:ABC-type multidrug transport system fused ATPase/permease subunit
VVVVLGFLAWVFTSLMEFVAWICFIGIIIIGIVVGNLVGDGEFNFWVALLVWVIGTVILAMTFGVFGSFLVLVKNVGEISDSVKRLDEISYNQERMLACFSNSDEQIAQRVVPKIFCKNCGEELNKEEKFCVNCGTKCN